MLTERFRLDFITYRSLVGVYNITILNRVTLINRVFIKTYLCLTYPVLEVETSIFHHCKENSRILIGTVFISSTFNLRTLLYNRQSKSNILQWMQLQYARPFRNWKWLLKQNFSSDEGTFHVSGNVNRHNVKK